MAFHVQLGFMHFCRWLKYNRPRVTWFEFLTVLSVLYPMSLFQWMLVHKFIAYRLATKPLRCMAITHGGRSPDVPVFSVDSRIFILCANGLLTLQRLPLLAVFIGKHFRL